MSASASDPPTDSLKASENLPASKRSQVQLWYDRPLAEREPAARVYAGIALAQLGLNTLVLGRLERSAMYRDVADLMLADQDIATVRRIGETSLAEIDRVLVPLFERLQGLNPAIRAPRSGEAGGPSGSGDVAGMQRRWLDAVSALDDRSALRDRRLDEAGWPLHLIAVVQVDTIGDLARIPRSRASAIWSLVSASLALRDELLQAVERLAALPSNFDGDAWAEYLRSMGVMVVPEGYTTGGAMDMKTALLETVRHAVLSTCPERDWSILQLRFGLDGGGRKTLQAVGDRHGLTREAVRLVQVKAFDRVRDSLSGTAMLNRGQQIHPDVVESLATFEHLFARVRVSPMREDRLEAWCRDILGEDAVRTDREPEPIVEMLAKLHGVVVVSMDRARLLDVWIRDDRATVAAVRQRVQRVHDVLFLKPSTGPMTDVELAEAVNAKVRRGSRLSPEAVGEYAELCSAVERLPDGGFIGRDAVVQSKFRAERILIEAGEPLHVAEIARRFNLETAQHGRKPIPGEQASAMMSANPHVVPLGRSGYWAHVDWRQYSTEPIADLIATCLREHDRPMTREAIFEWVSARRPLSSSSVTTYLGMDSRFLRLADGAWSLRDWVAPRGYVVAKPRAWKGLEDSVGQARRLAASVLADRPDSTMPLMELRTLLKSKLGLSESGAAYRISRIPELEVFSTGGRSKSVRWRGPLPPEE